MKAVVVTPTVAGSGRVIDVPDPKPGPGEVLVNVHEVGLDGTDAEILRGDYGDAPPGDDYLIVGHESLGRVEDAPPDSGLDRGDWVVAIVRRPDAVPCRNCAADEWDMCLNGQYTERGIKGRHGYLSEYFSEVPKFLVKVPVEIAPVAVLLEPLTIAEKALDQINRIQSRLAWQAERAIVLGAGPVGLLAAMALRLQGLDVFVYDQAEGGIKKALVEQMGAEYIWAQEHELDHELAARIGMVDVAFEATGFSPLAFKAMDIVRQNGIVCLSGVSGGQRNTEIQADHLNLEIVLGNKVIFGTVNANRRHFEAGVGHLEAAYDRWPQLLQSMITRRFPIEEFADALAPSANDVKRIVVVRE